MVDISKLKTVEDFIDYDFERTDVPDKYLGDYTHANFFKKYFIPIARRRMRKIAEKIGAKLTFSGGYFYFSGFLERNGACVYFYVGDVRYNLRWYDSVLYRDAKDTSDYHGGVNRYCSFDDLEENADWLLESLVLAVKAEN